MLDETGKPLPALLVYTETLRYLKSHVLHNTNQEEREQSVNEKDVTWVLTVPTTWNRKSREFLLTAAVKV